MKPKAIYAGSFDPFTVGHMDVVRKASSVFDVTILIAENINKKHIFTAELREQAISECMRSNGIPFHIEVCSGLIAEYASQNNITFLIRGLRNFMDYGYEEDIAQINKEINPDLETIYFRSDRGFISSTFVRDLITHKKDVSSYIPYDINMLIE